MAAESGIGLPGPEPLRSGANPPLADGRSPLQRAIQDIHETVRTPTHATLRAARTRALVAQLDGLIGELEEVHLRGGIRVPDRIVARLERFLDSLPEQFRGSFALRTKVIYVLDDLFETQDLLLNLKVPGRHTIAATELALAAEPGRNSRPAIASARPASRLRDQANAGSAAGSAAASPAD